MSLWPGRSDSLPHLGTERVPVWHFCKALMKTVFCSPFIGPLIPLPQGEVWRRPGCGSGHSLVQWAGGQLSSCIKEGWRPGEMPTWEKELVSPTSRQGGGCFLFSCLGSQGGAPFPACGQDLRGERGCDLRCLLAQRKREWHLFLDQKGGCCCLC